MQRLPFIAFVASFIALVSLVAFGFGMFSFHSKNFAYTAVLGIKSDLKKLKDPKSREALVEGFLFWHLQPARGQGEGVTVNLAPDEDALVMMAGFFDEENQIRLIGRDGEIVHKWSLNYLEHFPDPANRPCELTDPLGVDTHGVLITPKGELVFNYEYCGTVKLGYCGGVEWTLDRLTHHSVVASEGGGYLILDRETWLADEHPNRAHPFPQIFAGKVILEDFVLWVSEDGEITDKLSIPQTLLDGGLAAELTSNRSGLDSFVSSELQILHSN